MYIMHVSTINLHVFVQDSEGQTMLQIHIWSEKMSI